MVYVVVVVGLAVTFAPVVADNPVAGLHAYVEAPLAFNAVDCPAHIVGLAGVTETTGNGFTLTVAVAVLVHPAALVPVTVYVIVLVGLAVTFAPVVALKPVDGDQVYVEAPEAVKLTDAPIQIFEVAGVTATKGRGFTVILILPVPPQGAGVVYVMVCVPTPAVPGLNVPFVVLVIPGPAHVPPETDAVKFIAVALTQNGPAGLIIGIVGGFTVTVAVTGKLAHPFKV